MLAHGNASPATEADLHYASARAQAALVRRGDLSARELVGLSIRRAEQTAGVLNCLSSPLFEEAFDQARKIDEALSRGDDPGPLCGVPVTVKDGVATVGHRQTFGSRSMADVVAQVDDVVWTRLKSAGAILLGKTTTPEFYHQVTTHSPLHGVTRNPWSPAHTPGGSSGGSAAALAAGVGAVAVGSDGGGSLRCPASCTGIFALKATPGRIPHEYFPDTFANFSSLGPMARDVGDLEVMFAVMSGPAERDAVSLARPRYQAETADGATVQGLKVGWLQRPGGYPVNPEIIERGHAALAILEQAGGRIEPDFSRHLLDGAFAAYRVIGTVGHAGRLRHQGEADRALWSDSFRDLVEVGLSFSASDLSRAQENRTALFHRVQEAFRDVDLIATPTLAGAPLAADARCSIHEDEYAAWAAALYPFNLTGHPAMSIPCGFGTDGLPIGIQFIAPWFEERRLFKVAAILQHAMPTTQRPPL